MLSHHGGMTPVKSSNIKAIGYDAKSHTLTVQFNSGTYDYHGVPADVHSALMKAESVGSHFHEHVRGGGYKHTKHE